MYNILIFYYFISLNKTLNILIISMDDKQRLQLQNMIKANNVEDQTDFIRNLKHSQIIRNEVNSLIMIKSKFRGDDVKIHEEGVNECNFLFTYYTDIYNKITFMKKNLNEELKDMYHLFGYNRNKILSEQAPIVEVENITFGDSYDEVFTDQSSGPETARATPVEAAG